MAIMNVMAVMAKNDMLEASLGHNDICNVHVPNKLKHVFFLYILYNYFF